MNRARRSIVRPVLWAVFFVIPIWTSSALAVKPLMVVSDSPYEIFQGNKSKVQVVVYSNGFRPVAGAEVFAGQKLVGQTDRDGTLIFSHRPRGSFMLRAKAEIDGQPAAGSVRMEVYRRTSSFESANLFVNTDRGVYRPGEEILVRTIAWRLRGEFRPLNKALIEVGLHDPAGKPITGSEMKTAEFGVAASRLRVPEDAPEGVYQLRVRYRGAEEVARLRVERFRAPAISIEHNLPRFIAPTTPDLALEAKLAYFTGSVPAEGTFEVGLVFRGQSLFKASRPIVKGQVIRLSLPLEKVRKVVPDGERFRVVMKARDGFGRADEVKRDILYAKKPYVAVADLDKDVYVAGETVNISLRLVDPDGVPVRGKALSLKGDGDRIKLQATSDEGGIALFSFAMPDHAVQVQVFSDDVPGALVQRQVPFMASKPLRAKISRPVVKERRRTPIEITFEEGFVPVERVVHLDVVDSSGAMVGAFKIPIRRKRGRFVARGSFRAPSWGSMLVVMYTAGKSPDMRKKSRRPSTVGLLTEGLSLTVHPDKELQVRLDGVPDTAPPRSQIKGRVAVKTAQGKPAQALLGAMVVDRAVLSLLDPLEKTPMDRFYNPTLKVLSTTGSDILTWPVVSRNWGDQQYDIALPPFGFRPGARFYRPKRRRGSAKLSPMKAKPTASIGALGDMDGVPDMDDAISAAPMAERAEDEDRAPEPARTDGLLKNDKAKGAVSSRAGRGKRPRGKALPKIVIRTDLPATTWWEPRLRVRGGRAQLSFKLPEALTEQELIVLASDKRGGLGLLRKRIKVSQPLFVRSDLPRTMLAGDALEAGVSVRNTTGAPLSALVSLSAPGLDVSPASQKIELPAAGSAAVRFKVKAAGPRTSTVKVTVLAGEFSDGEERQLEVRPRGPGVVEEFQASLKKGQDYRLSISKGADEFVEAHLELAFPTVVPALQEMEQILSGSTWWADGHLATPLAACQLERYLARHQPNHPLRKGVRSYLKEVANWLPGSFNSDGGTFWWRSGSASNPLASAWALKLMAALRDSDIAVPSQSIMGAVAYLKQQREPDGLWNLSATAFWEGSTEKVRLQLGAQIFRALAEAARVERMKPAQRAWIEELSGRFAKVLDDGSSDPLTSAEAAQGLLALELGRKKGKLPMGAPMKRLIRAALKLVEMRRVAHWEPSWFHAYGGSIEATVSSLELLARLDPKRFESEIRAGLLYLLSTRKEWGQWHCPFGTAEAIRAFSLLPPPRREIRSTVSVTLGQTEIARVKVNPRDPYLSAIRLRHLALGSLLKQGQNKISVKYDGRLEVPLRLVVRRFGSGGQPNQPVWREGPQLKRTMDRAAVGLSEPAAMRLSVSQVSSAGGPLRLFIPLPANARVLDGSIGLLRKQAGVLAVDQGPQSISLLLAGNQSHNLTLSLEGVRLGKVSLPAAVLHSTAGSHAQVRSDVAKFEVRP